MSTQESRPAGNGAATTSAGGRDDQAMLTAHADNALHCAWLRVHADLLYDVDPGGQLSAQLRDLADLLDEGR